MLVKLQKNTQNHLGNHKQKCSFVYETLTINHIVFSMFTK